MEDKEKQLLKACSKALADLVSFKQLSEGVYGQTALFEVKDGNLKIHSFEVQEMQGVKDGDVREGGADGAEARRLQV